MNARVKALKDRFAGVPGPRLRIRQISRTRLEVAVWLLNGDGTTLSPEQAQVLVEIKALSGPYAVAAVTMPNELVDAAFNHPR